ncbi:MAG TPA: tetratricopeptide repeat protein [Vicinamibacterales bacterium]
MVADSKPDVHDESVRHLVELGYFDPDEVSAAEVARRRRHETDLGHAVTFLGQGDGREAVTRLERIVADDPTWTSPRQLLAEAQYRTGNWLESRVHLDWLEHHGVVTPKLATIAGAMALARRDLTRALDELTYAAHVESTLVGVHALLGSTLLRLGRHEAAKTAFEQAIQRDASDVQALDGLAAVALRCGDFEGAAHWALEALEHDMQQFRAHYHLGVALIHLGQPDAAAEAFATCARLAPTRAAPFYWLSRVAAGQGNAARTTEYREQARAIVRQRRGLTST